MDRTDWAIGVLRLAAVLAVAAWSVHDSTARYAHAREFGLCWMLRSLLGVQHALVATMLAAFAALLRTVIRDRRPLRPTPTP